MTQFLFRENPYITELKAKITSINGNNITFDSTIFFSFSGGQQSDSGTINDIEVIESKKEAEEIYYTLFNASTLKVGDEVEIKIDEVKRDKIMRLHSAVHIVGDFFERIQKIPLSQITGSNVEENKARLDYIFSTSVAPLLASLELEVNKFLEQEHEIKHYLKQGDEWEWSCNNFKCPCGGTHVRNTKEIGRIKLKRKNIGSGKERIEVYLN